MTLHASFPAVEMEPADSPVIDVFGLPVRNLSTATALQHLGNCLAQPGFTKLGFLNAHGSNLASRDADYKDILQDFLLFPDGIGIDIAARLLTGKPFLANLNGTDFVPLLLKSLPGPLRIALYGAEPGIAERAAQSLRRLAPQHAVLVSGHGYLDPPQVSGMLDQLHSEPVDILLVALGNPHQERFIASHVTGEHARLAIGVGALFDFLAGAVPRAPTILRTLRLEWLFRFSQEPRRLFRRYVLGNPAFLMRVLLHRQRAARQARSR